MKKFVLLLTLFAGGVKNIHAMEPNVIVNKTKLFELFTELPAELKEEIIIAAAKIGTLQEAVENIRNLALVNKKFNQFINSEAGINTIINDGLMENKNIQSFFDQLAKLNKSYRDQGKKYYFESLGFNWQDMSTANFQKDIILIALLTKQATTTLMQRSPEWWENLEYGTLIPLAQLVPEMTQYSQLFKRTLVFVGKDPVK